MKKILVDRNFIECAKVMASDLYNLADINKNIELKKNLRLFIKKADRYLNKID